MKRATPEEQDDGPNATKRARLEDINETLFSEASLERSCSAVERLLAEGNHRGWIAGTVEVKWGVMRGRLRFQLLSSAGERLEVQLHGDEASELDLVLHDFLQISLRGGETKPRRSGAAQCQFILSFPDGFCIARKANGQEAPNVIDVWQMRARKLEDWFTSPRPSQEPVLTETFPQVSQTLEPGPKSTISGDELSSVPPPAVEARPVEHNILSANSHNGDNASSTVDNLEITTTLEVEPHSSDPLGVPSDRRDAAGGGHLKLKESLHDNGTNIKQKEPIPNKITSLSKKEKKDLRARKEEKRNSKKAKRKQNGVVEPPARDPALDMEAGFNSEIGRYTALVDISKMSLYTSIHVIGVVVKSLSPTRTQNMDWKTTVYIVDPSVSVPFAVMCFNKKIAEWLPSPSPGHIILFRDLKTSLNRTNNTINAVGYPDRLQWVAFNPVTGRYYHNDLNGQPSRGIKGGGYGAEFSPFHEPGKEELIYCVKLAEWHRAVEEQNPTQLCQVTPSSSQRELRLIGDQELGRFFDAVIEIFSSQYDPDHNYMYITVTDYTSHRLADGGPPLRQRGIACSTSKFEESLCKQVVPGTYWKFTNVRLKLGKSGALEMDLFAARLKRIDEREEPSEGAFQDLLRRKTEFNQSLTSNQHNSHKQLDRNSSISDLELGGRYDLVVELLYVSHEDRVAELFVTDYTANPNVNAFVPRAIKQKCSGLCILKIAVWGDQGITREMEPGAHYLIRSLKVQQESHNSSLKCSLNNADDNVKRIRTSNADVQELLIRKADFRGVARPPFAPARDSPTEEHERNQSAVIEREVVFSRHKDQLKTTIKEIRQIKLCPNKFRLVARIEDFWPLDLKDFTVPRCRNCLKLIPPTRKACIDCADMSGEYVEWIFQFFFMLQDETDTIVVHCGEEADIFLGIKPLDLSINDAELDILTERLKPLLGNLLDVHESLQKKSKLDPQFGPYMDLAIDSQRSERGKIVYGLTGCNIIG